jgi:hypothetical protein
MITNQSARSRSSCKPPDDKLVVVKVLDESLGKDKIVLLWRNEPEEIAVKQLRVGYIVKEEVLRG